MILSGPDWVREQLKAAHDLWTAVLADTQLITQISIAADAVVAALAEGCTVYTCGNGGSTTDAAHLAEELIGRYRDDRRPLPAVHLAADPSALTCIANDYGFEEIFARQIEALGSAKDVLVVFTTSGNSENINRALKRAAECSLKTICIAGKGGGESAKLADYCVIIPSDDTARIQEMHTFVLHMICEAAERRFKK